MLSSIGLCLLSIETPCACAARCADKETCFVSFLFALDMIPLGCWESSLSSKTSMDSSRQMQGAGTQEARGFTVENLGGVGHLPHCCWPPSSKSEAFFSCSLCPSLPSSPSLPFFCRCQFLRLLLWNGGPNRWPLNPMLLESKDRHPLSVCKNEDGEYLHIVI
jgi:hypothetical protein